MAFCWLAACPVAMAQHLSGEEAARLVQAFFHDDPHSETRERARLALQRTNDPQIARLVIDECEKTDCYKLSIVDMLLANRSKESIDFIREYEKELINTIHNGKHEKVDDLSEFKADHIILAGTMYAAEIDKEKYRNILEAYAKDEYDLTRGSLAAELENIPENWAIDILYDMYENDPMMLPKYFALRALIRLEPHEKLRKYLLSHCKKPEYMIQYMQHEFPEFDMSEPEAK